MTEHFRITVDLGPRAPLDQIVELLSDIQQVCIFGTALDIASVRNEAQSAINEQIIRNRAYIATESWREALEETPPPNLRYLPFRYFYENLVTSQEQLRQYSQNDLPPNIAESHFLLNRLQEDTTPRVETLRYSNPVEILISVGTILTAAGGIGASIRWLLPLIRDWGTTREQNRALARKTRADASKIEAEAESIRSQTECRERLMRAALEQISEGRMNISSSQLEATLTDETTGSVLRLVQNAPDISFEHEDAGA